MGKEMKCIVPHEKLPLKITTGDVDNVTVYEFGIPDKDGFRKTRRNDRESFYAKIVGPVMEPDQVNVSEATIMTRLNDHRVLVHGRMLKLGIPMGLWETKFSEETRISRPIVKIEII